MHSFDKAPGYCKTQSCASADAVALLDAIKSFEHQFQIIRRDAGTLVQNLQADIVLPMPSANMNGGASVRIFGCVVEEVEENLFEKNRVDVDKRQIFGEFEPNFVPVKILLALLSTAPIDSRKS